MDWTHLWNQAVPYLQQFATIVILPLAVALIKSETLALDNSTQANGLVHGWRLFKSFIAVVPQSAITALEAKSDAILPGSSQVVEAIIKEDTPNEANTFPSSTGA